MPAITTESIRSDLTQRLRAGYPLLFLRTHEEARWEAELSELMLELERGLVVWSQTAGLQPAVGNVTPESDPLTVLEALSEYPEEHVFLLKDFHPHLSDPAVIRRLRDYVETMPAKQQAILLLDPVGRLPTELEKDALAVTLPLPDYQDFRGELDEMLQASHGLQSVGFELNPDEEDRLIKAVLGLTLAEGKKAWRRALLGQTSLTEEALAAVIAEKRHLASASDLLEFYDLDAGVDDVGGLDQLKDWLRHRAMAYSPRAREQGIPLPKGALLLGVQGCGKSLTARATARLLSFPLIRLDVANLLSSGRGETEKNLRDVLRLVESIAPVVLWLDELEKGFAGLESTGGSDATMNRLVGTFLLWMQEQTKQVFTIATANSVQHLPPELLRRGRFDELFFIDLPNFHERKHVLTIHLKRRGWKPERFDLDELSNKTEGFSGAELEQVVSAAMIDAFGRNTIMGDDELDRARRNLVPLSVTMEDKIFALRQWAQDRCRRATSDNRVAQMLDLEQRQGILDDDDAPAALPSWAALAQAGQLKAAVVEYVRRQGEVIFPQLMDGLRDYVTVDGDLGLAVRTNPNTVLWLGMSQELCDVLAELIALKRLYVHPTEIERYQRAQQKLRLPLLGEPTDERLAKPRWLASSLRTGPHTVHGHRLARVGRIQLSQGKEAQG